MRVTIIAVLLGLVSIQSWAGKLPEGSYAGKGLWASSADRGNYKVTTKISQDSVSADYILADGSKKEWIFKIVPTTGNFFKVTVYGLEVGEGYCLDKVDLCHYQVKIKQLSLEETLTSRDGKFYRFGSKDTGSGTIVWQEAYQKN